MTNKKDESVLQDMANAAILVFISRLSAPILVALCAWIASNVVDAKVAIGKVQQAVEDYDKRIDGLEKWRMTIDQNGHTRVFRSN